MINEETGETDYIDDYLGFIAENAMDENGGTLDIPVYRESEILHSDEVSFYLGRDLGYYIRYSWNYDSFKRMISMFPTSAVRSCAEGKYIYVIYDTDQKTRIFKFFSKDKNSYYFSDGFMVLMKKTLCYKDISALRVGDGMGLVLAIDPIAALYKESFDRGNDQALKSYADMGAPPTSIHLLTDGILKIEYARDEDGYYVITDIEYDSDFILDGFRGQTCYRICAQDYPDGE